MTAHTRIACIFAHPDDETFCVGGIVAKYAEAGIPIDLFCATNGDAGKSASVPVSSREELAALRRSELRAACDILGIGEIKLAGYPDGGLETVEPKKLIGDIVAFIRRTQPSVILGFGPEGAPTGHRDHTAMSRATTAAFFLSGLATQFAEQGLAPFSAKRLYFHAWQLPMRDPRLVLESVPATVAIDVRPWKAKKVAAFKAHVTQQGSASAFYDGALNDDEYLAFGAGVPQSRAMIADVFDGL
jgi:LmbE family N-acetylglucosaminyl deacetylase